jgi:hypothetical protein
VVVAYNLIMTPTLTNRCLTSASARPSNARRASRLQLWGALAVSVFVAGAVAAAAPPRIDENDLVTAGFKVLVPTNKAQVDWVQRLAPGEIRPMQRTGKKFFICPDASRKQIYVGGPNEYEAYMQLHPDTRIYGQDAAKNASAYRSKQNEKMQKATARDASNPFLGATWNDLGW